MSTYTIQQLRSLWRKGGLTAEQAVGHIIQDLLALSERLAALEKLSAQRPAAPVEPPSAPPELD